VSQSVSVWFVVLVAFMAANTPFVSHRFLALRRPAKPKTLGIRFLELLIFYFLAGGVALLLESRAGQAAPQTWEFYAITATLFVTFAFPGFVYRYLLKNRD
jgi:hypothetical protein